MKKPRLQLKPFNWCSSTGRLKSRTCEERNTRRSGRARETEPTRVASVGIRKGVAVVCVVVFMRTQPQHKRRWCACAACEALRSCGKKHTAPSGSSRHCLPLGCSDRGWLGRRGKQKSTLSFLFISVLLSSFTALLFARLTHSSFSFSSVFVCHLPLTRFPSYLCLFAGKTTCERRVLVGLPTSPFSCPSLSSRFSGPASLPPLSNLYDLSLALHSLYSLLTRLSAVSALAFCSLVSILCFLQAPLRLGVAGVDWSDFTARSLLLRHKDVCLLRRKAVTLVMAERRSVVLPVKVR